MLFKFKEKKITIDFFTDNYATYELFKIKKVSRNKPKWFNNDLAIRHCAGMTDFFNKAYLIEAWTDISINVGSDGVVTPITANKEVVFGENHHSERGAFLPQDQFQHIKIVSPWLADASQSIPCLFFAAVWHNERYIDRISYLPAVRDLYYSKRWNMHFFINKNNIQGYQEFINIGDPLQYFVPLTDKKVEVKTHYDPEMVQKLITFRPQSHCLGNKVYLRYKKIVRDKNSKDR